jgi:hypothetical protein
MEQQAALSTFAPRDSAEPGARLSPRPFSRILLALPFLPLLLLFLAPPAFEQLRAASILREVGGVSGFMGSDATAVVAEEIVYPSLAPTRARIYYPVGIVHPSPVVVVHGAHYLGMNEPRLVRLATALAHHGYLVLTPQVDELADYSITKKSAVVIGGAVHELARRSGAKVGLLGLSFAGGMSLIAACDPSVARQLSVVVAVGAHDDLRRVLDFFNTNETRAPDGSVLHMQAHEYGSLIVAYDHANALFSPADAPRARRALRALLHQQLPLAHAEAAKLSPQGRARMALLFAHDTRGLMADTERGLAAVQAELDAASPNVYLSHLQVPAMLLHGAGDNVVPPTETLWLAHDIPARVLRAALISPAISHVSLGGTSAIDRFRLVQWMRQMLELLDTSNAQRL